MPITSLDPQRVRDYLDNCRTQLWAEALARRADPAWLPDILRDSQDQHNETFRATDALVEDVVVRRQLLWPLVLPHLRMLPACLKTIVPMVFRLGAASCPT